MEMEVDIKLAEYDEKYLLKKMLELYMYDLSSLENSDLNDFGEYGYRYLDLYWIESNRFPFILRVNQKLAGFALINKFAYTKGIDYAVAEFFILKKYRNEGLGRKLAFKIFQQFFGRWEIRTLTKNIKAKRFWREIIEQYASENMKEFSNKVKDKEVTIWTFTSEK
ncbi:MAG: GNAT family N-acetyltransferase [Cyanobacteriota bacterium]|nr:GNAT family N-acetyltransferase [Cyanobacteriota bacterium]